jgi:hypothetical protein
MDISQLLGSDMGNNVTSMIAGKLGLDENQASSAVSMALPAIMGSLSQHASTPEGAQALTDHLSSNVSSGGFDNIESLLGGGDAHGGFLSQVLGGKAAVLQQAVGQHAGIDAGTAGQVMQMLAPVVMQHLGQQQSTDASNGIGGILGGIMSQGASASPDKMSMISQLLDRDHDGSAVDDVLGMGKSLLGGLL